MTIDFDGLSNDQLRELRERCDDEFWQFWNEDAKSEIRRQCDAEIMRRRMAG